MKKRALTLIEMMIVIFLITLITGAIGYSMKGALEKGRAFRTEQAREQLHDLLLIALADGGKADEIASNPEAALKKLGLAKDPSKLIVDGWNEKFEITPSTAKNDFTVISKAWIRYNNRMNRQGPQPVEADEE
jgi:type II secretory pathway pseudopilin PulG